MSATPWNSLEIVKLCATVVAPAILMLLGYFSWDEQRLVVERHELDLRQLQSVDASEKQAQENLRQLRVGIYADAAPAIREILAYHFHVGDWKELSPADVLKMKRELDHSIYGHEAVLSSTLSKRYYEFMREAFVAAGNWQDESRLRTSGKCRRLPAGEDPRKWLAWFTDEDNRAALCGAYTRLRDYWRVELSLPKGSDERERDCPPFYTFADCA